MSRSGKTIFLLATLSSSSSSAPTPEDCLGRWLVRYTTGENNTCQSLLGTSRNDLILDHCVIFSQLRKLAIPIVYLLLALSIWPDAKTLFSFSSASTTWKCTCTDSEKLLEIKHQPRCWQFTHREFDWLESNLAWSNSKCLHTFRKSSAR